MRVIIQNLGAFILAVVLCSPSAAQKDRGARFEFATASLYFTGPAAEDTSASEQRSPRKSAERSESLADPVKAASSDAVRTLNIFVLVGNHAVNSVRSRSATAPIVEVRDERNLPIQGAEVVFQLPSVGASGFFTGQKLTWTGKTDANGQVVTAALSPNHETGRFDIRVTASYGGRLARAIISQTNSLKPVPPEGQRVTRRWGWWKVAAVAGAGAAVGGIVWASRRGVERPTVVLQPGIITFGGPR